jgi:hypothetical protein
LEPVASADNAEEEARLAKTRALLTAALAEECRKQQQVDALKQQLLKEYPHGLPVRGARAYLELDRQLGRTA